MNAQIMLNAAARSHFYDKDYTSSLCEGGVCNDGVVKVMDKCTGVLCNKDYCNGTVLDEYDFGIVPAFAGTVGGTVGIFLILLLCSCFCKPKPSQIQIDNDTSNAHTAVELVNQRNDTSASI